MHKYLYGTVAVVALSSFMFAQPAQAGADVSLDTGMYYTVSLAIHEDDSDDDVHFFSTRQDGEIYFEITSKFENELEITAHVELEAADTGDQIDEGYIDVKGKFGLFRMGADDAVSEAMTFGIPSAGVPGGSVDDPTYFYSNSNVTPDTGLNGIGGDSNGVRYFTPRVEGFQFGVSYQPDGEASGGNFGSGGILRDNDSVENIFSVAANFDREFENVALKASVFYQTAEDNQEAAILPGNSDADTDDVDGQRGDPTSYGFAFTVGFSGFEIGGAWSQLEENDLFANERTGYGIGISYGKDAWKFGAQWVHTEDDILANITTATDAVTGDITTTNEFALREIDAFALEGSYAMGAGVTLGGGLYYYDHATNELPAADNRLDSYAAALVLGLSF